ncbi:MAG: hypothetical protein KKD99_00210 [Proteobacteria bacterium]|nr:hypothetical protein [Pseudomonadota bacterium]MBU4355628.1 hypothetical protein [Pseudomonadota bacterium]MBU4446975.1 hypothetical protein [Pseudomonadota bacterium]
MQFTLLEFVDEEKHGEHEKKVGKLADEKRFPGIPVWYKGQCGRGEDQRPQQKPNQPRQYPGIPISQARPFLFHAFTPTCAIIRDFAAALAVSVPNCWLGYLLPIFIPENASIFDSKPFYEKHDSTKFPKFQS